MTPPPDAPERPEEVLAQDEAIERLATLDQGRARVAELHDFGGLTYEGGGQAS